MAGQFVFLLRIFYWAYSLRLSFRLSGRLPFRACRFVLLFGLSWWWCGVRWDVGCVGGVLVGAYWSGYFFCRAPFLPARGGVVMSVLLGAFRFVFSFFFSSGVT